MAISRATRLFLSCAFAATFASAASAAIISEFNDPTEVWSSHAINAVISNGQYNGTIAMNDPNMWRNEFTTAANKFSTFEADANPYVSLRLTIPANYPTHAQFFWTNPGGTFNGSQQQSFAITPGTTQTYVVNMSQNPYWSHDVNGYVNNRISQFRLDPTLSANDSDGVGASFKIDYIRVSSSATNSYALGIDNFTDADSSDWSFANMTPTESGNHLHGISGVDAQMTRDIPDFPGAGATHVTVNMRAYGPTGQYGQIYYSTTSDTNPYPFNESQSGKFNIIADGQFHTYVLDFSNDPNWTNDTIKLLRFDPTQLSGVTFDVASLSVDNLTGPSSPAPEPASLALLGLGAAGLLLRRRR